MWLKKHKISVAICHQSSAPDVISAFFLGVGQRNILCPISKKKAEIRAGARDRLATSHSCISNYELLTIPSVAQFSVAFIDTLLLLLWSDKYYTLVQSTNRVFKIINAWLVIVR